MVSSSSNKNAKRNKSRRNNSRRIGDCTVTDLFRFQDQLEFVFGIVFLIASVVHFNLDLIRKCCPKYPPEATLEAIEAYKADVKHLCQQFSTTYKRGNADWSRTSTGFLFDDKTTTMAQKWAIIVTTLSNWIAILEINLVPTACSSVWYHFDEKVDKCKIHMSTYFEKTLREDADLRRVVNSINNFRLFKLFKCVDNDSNPTLFKFNYNVNVAKYNVIVQIYERVIVKLRVLFNFPNQKNIFETRDVFELLLHRFELLYSTRCLDNKRQKMNEDYCEHQTILDEDGEQIDLSPSGSFLRQCYNKFLYDYALSDEHTKTTSKSYVNLTRIYVGLTFPNEPHIYEHVNPSNGYDLKMMEQCHSMNFILYMMGRKLEQKLREDVGTWSLFCLLKMRWGYIKERGIAIDVHKMLPSQDLVRALDLVLKNVDLFKQDEGTTTSTGYICVDNEEEHIENFDQLKLLCMNKIFF